MLHKWEEKSRDFIGNFLEMFGRDGRIVSTPNFYKREKNNDKSHSMWNWLLRGSL